jgi:CBS domain-containing protein
MLVKDAMSSQVEWVGPDICLRDTAKKMDTMGVGSLPVEENDKLIGIITDRDITCRAVAEARDAVTTPVRDVMSKEITFCYDDQDVADVAKVMEEKQIRRMPVLDRDGRLVGILTLTDLSLNAEHKLADQVTEAVATRH